MKKYITITLVCLFVSTSLLAIKKSKLEWQKVGGIAAYEVKVRNKLTGEVQSFITSDDHIWVELSFGLYEMKIIAYDRRNRVATQTDWTSLAVLQTYQPHVHSMNMSDNRSNITIRGDNLYNRTKIILRNENTDIPSTVVQVDYPKSITIQTNLNKNSKYSMDVKNPGGYEDGKVLHVFHDDSIMLFEDDYEYSRYFSPFFLEFGANYPVQYNSYWKDTYKQTYISCNFIAGYHIVPWFGFLGGFDYTQYTNSKTASGEIELYTHIFTPQAGIFVCYKHKNVIPYVDATGGISLSVLALNTAIEELRYNSTDLYYSAGGGVKVFVWRHLFLDPAVHYNEILLKAERNINVSYRLGAGWYF
ncbi:MAG: hypothetical protein ACOCWH_05965 [Spirochaetota bacterium]